MEKLPLFGLCDYANLIKGLLGSGYQFALISEMRHPTSEQLVYLRHDIDLHISLVLDMARFENACGVRATYFVPLTLHFNPLYPPNRRILQELCALGHEVGLHYDLQTYPSDLIEAAQHLDWEARTLGEIVGTPVRTIVMHEPYKGQPDPFQSISEYIHPHDPHFQMDLVYISDSCRAWRDDKLLSCFGINPPRRLLLTIHPELWLDDTINDRIKYLDTVLLDRGIRQHWDYFDQTVRQAWLTHAAPRLHDKRKQDLHTGGQS